MAPEIELGRMVLGMSAIVVLLAIAIWAWGLYRFHSLDPQHSTKVKDNQIGFGEDNIALLYATVTVLFSFIGLSWLIGGVLHQVV